MIEYLAKKEQVLRFVPRMNKYSDCSKEEQVLGLVLG
jgi:hypothetical protein